MLKDKAIKIDRSRMDCGSFTQEVVQMVEKHSQLFYIRAQPCPKLTAQIKAVTKWERATIGFKEVEIYSVEYKPFSQEKSYRYVVSRSANKTGQTDVFKEITLFTEQL